MMNLVNRALAAKKKILTFVLCTLSLFPLSAALLPDTIVAFPGAEGFGKYTSGGRGGKVVYVTSLADDADGTTEGTLRWAMKQHPDTPITVCFAVSGEIRLVKDLRLNRRSNFTWAGQTAPGMGIVITHNKVNFGGSQNFIVRNIRFRVGNEDANGKFLNANAFAAENCSNFIIDHCDFGWSSEENMNTFDGHFFTVQYCIVHEGLFRAGNGKGDRSYGCQWGGSPASYHHNLLTNNHKRACRFNGARNNDSIVYLDYINNVVYNYNGGDNGCYGGETNSKIEEYNGLNAAHEVNFINNYYKPGVNTQTKRYFFRSDYARDGATSWAPSKWYVAGNIMEGNSAVNANNWQAVSVQTYTLDQIRVDTMIRPKLNYYCWVSADSVRGRYDFDMYAYAVEAYETANSAYETVLDTAGAFPRDHVELRLIREVREGSTTYKGRNAQKLGIIDHAEDAEGFYEYPVVAPLADTDLDGMPDAWESANGCNPQVADNNVRHASGYTMLEMYLDYAMQKAPMDDGYQEPQGIDNVQTDRIQSTKILRDGQLLILRGEKIYTLQGQELK